jgi:NAD(P)-dependent dehydrogenase (short-subunit alcohol dehydrogenase family)
MLFEGKPFEGQVALVTGGGTGLGRAMALRLAGLGATLVIAGRRQEVLDDTAKEIQALGADCLTHAVDIRDHERVEAMVDAIHHHFGKIDILINNAAGNFLCPSEKLSINGFNAVVNIVLHGTWHVTQSVCKRMLADNRPGKVLSILATYAWTGSPLVLPSAMAKAGLLAMTRSLAVEWGPRGIRFNAIAPGAILTEGASEHLNFASEEGQKRIRDTNPLQRLGAEEELANLAAFLVSDYSAYINGDCVTMDGGGWLSRGSFRMQNG